MGYLVELLCSNYWFGVEMVIVNDWSGMFRGMLAVGWISDPDSNSSVGTSEIK